MTYMPHTFEPDRVISVVEVGERVTFSRMHVWQLQSEGMFPKSVRLNSRRAVWRLSDVRAWMQQKVDARVGSTAITISADDRFIMGKEACRITSLSPQQLNRLEERGEFPMRVRLSVQRVAWLEREVQQWMQEI
jgi:predicted DNA-binding transcriptional regulator AlpA